MSLGHRVRARSPRQFSAHTQRQCSLRASTWRASRCTSRAPIAERHRAGAAIKCFILGQRAGGFAILGQPARHAACFGSILLYAAVAAASCQQQLTAHWHQRGGASTPARRRATQTARAPCSLASFSMLSALDYAAAPCCGGRDGLRKKCRVSCAQNSGVVSSLKMIVGILETI